MDPTEGDSIEFGASNFVGMPDVSFSQMAIMPLVKLVDSQPIPIGTCFSITNSGMCLTARHVIEEAFPTAVSTGRSVHENDGWIYALYASPTKEGSGHPDHDLGGLLPVNRVHFANGVDIAALHLNLPVNSNTGERLKMPAHRLALAPPKVGEQCIAIGYHEMNWSADGDHLSINQKFSATKGIVEEVHIPRRDLVQLNFPCFRLSARFDGGMSGAPVFTNDGLVRGVVCSSFKTDGESDHISHASLVAPAMLLVIEARSKIDGPITKQFLWDFAVGGAMFADKDGVNVHRKNDECAIEIGGGIIVNKLLS